MRGNNHTLWGWWKGILSVLLALCLLVFPLFIFSQASESWTFNYVDADPYDYDFPADNLPKCYAQNDSGYQVYGISANIENANSGGDGNEWVVTDSIGGVRRKFNDDGEYDFMDALPLGAAGFFLLNDGQIMRINNQGVIQWSHNLPFQSFRTCALDGNGDIWILGVKNGDPLLCKYSSAGSFVSAYRISTAINDFSVDFCIQPNGNLRVLTTNANSVSNLISLSPMGVILDQIQYNYPFSMITLGPDQSFYLAGGQRVMRCDTLGQPIWYQGISANVTPNFPFLSQENTGLVLLPNQSVAMAIRDVCYGGVYPDVASNGPFPWESGRIYIFAPDGQITYASRIGPGSPSADPANNGLFALDLDNKGRLVAGHHVGETYIGVCQLGYCVYEYLDLYVKFDKICPPQSPCLSSTYAKSVQPVTPFPTISPLSATVLPIANPGVGGVTVVNSNIIYAISGPNCTACLPPAPTIGYLQDSLSFIFWVEPWVGNEDIISWTIGGIPQGNQLYFHYTFPNGIIPAIILEVRGACGIGRDTLELFPCQFAGFSLSVDTVCVNQAISITNTSFQSVTNQWYLNGALVSTQPNPTVSIPSTGFNFIELVANNGYCSDTARDSVFAVAPNLVAGFTFSHSLLSLQFQDTSLNALSWHWDFGDGNMSTQRNPVHTYVSGGTYPICLTVANYCDTLTVCDTFSCQPPQLAFSLQARNDSIWAFNQSTYYDSILWVLPNGSTFTQDTVFQITGQSGEHPIALVGWTACGVDTLVQSAFTFFPNDTIDVLFAEYVRHAISTQILSARESATGNVFTAGFGTVVGLGKQAFLAKRDGAGNALWKRTYGSVGDDQFNSIAPVSSGGMIAVGETQSQGAGNKDALIMRLDEHGQILWQKTVGGTGVDIATHILNRQNGKYIVTGTMTNPSGRQEAWTSEWDTLGNQTWSRTFSWMSATKGIQSDEDEWGNIYVLASMGPYFDPTSCTEGPEFTVAKLMPNGQYLKSYSFYSFGYPNVMKSLAVGNGKIIVGGFSDIDYSRSDYTNFPYSYPTDMISMVVADTGQTWVSAYCMPRKDPNHFLFSVHLPWQNYNLYLSDTGATFGGEIQGLEYLGNGKFMALGVVKSDQVNNIETPIDFFGFQFNFSTNSFTPQIFESRVGGVIGIYSQTKNVNQVCLEPSGALVISGNERFSAQQNAGWVEKTNIQDYFCDTYRNPHYFILNYQHSGPRVSSNAVNSLAVTMCHPSYCASGNMSSLIPWTFRNAFAPQPQLVFSDSVEILANTLGCRSSCDEVNFGLQYNATNDSIHASINLLPNVQYQWILNGNAMGSGDSISAALVCGQNVIEIRGTNSCGTFRNIITIERATFGTFSIGNDTAICRGDTVIAVSPSNWQNPRWSTGSLADTLIITLPGIYSLEATDSSGCTYTDQMVISDLFVPFSLGSDTMVCTGSPVMLSVPPGLLYPQWSTGSSANSITVTAQGTYSVSVTDMNGCWGSDTLNISWSPYSTIGLPPTIQICPGDTYSVSMPSGFTNPRWTNGETTPTIQLSQPGIYGLTADDVNGCESSSSTSLVFLPVPQFSFNTISYFCQGVSPFLYSPPGFSSYQWSTGHTGQFLYNAPIGMVSLTITNSYGCPHSDTTEVVVEAPVIPDFTFTPIGGGIQFTNLTPTPVDSFQWSFGDGTINKVDWSPMHYYANIGTYYPCLTVFSTESCQEQNICYWLNVLTVSNAPSSPESPFAPQIFPNPTSHLLSIRFGAAPLTPWRVTLHNALGQAILFKEVELGVEQVELDLSKLAEGPYWVRIELGNGQIWVEKVEVMR